MDFKIEGMEEIEAAFKRMGKVPLKMVSPAVRKAMAPIHKQAKADAPEDIGNLKRGIILKGERSRTKGKKVYRIAFDPAMNSIFQKPDADGKITGYYPVSQEYGYFTRGGKYIPGYAFIRGSFNAGANAASRQMIQEIAKNIEKAAK